ncbi:glycosyltransferase family 2 protein [Pontibacter sp. SGAir0037]|uniref:glycosyltransferase family 2 protein n=1 Tax=Pontibacter sp. SGAir0037 TaxID=2571030 RepID=UPI0010CCD81F|nr:glycosyltransferase [Pontibacter sp. SGAir0037]QCR22604.1 family 2 glycosyl transferase [Pontibacter sp. SGAir0037]
MLDSNKTNSDPFISVVIPTRHRNDYLAQCLDCLHPDVQSLKSDNYEVIVSDDGSLTTSESMIKEKYPWVRWVAGPRKGPAANRNNGVQHIRAPWIAFTDDDCLPNSNWIEAYVKAIKTNPSHNVFEGKTMPDREQQRFNEVSPRNEKGGYLWSCNLAVRANYYKEIGGYCEDFHFELEDIEFRTRVIKDGQELIFVPEASACHPWRLVNYHYKVGIDSVLTLLKRHPDHRKYYSLTTRLKILIPQSINIIPYAFKYKFRGLNYAIIDLLYEIKSAFLIQFMLWRHDRRLRTQR